MLDLAFVVFLTIWAAAVGLRLVRWCGPVPAHPADALALAIPLGLGTMALATLGLAESGLLGVSGLGVIGLIGIVLGVWGQVQRAPSSVQGGRGKVFVPRSAALPRPGHEDYAPATRTSCQQTFLATRSGAVGWGFDLALGATILGTLLTALAPVTDGDALCYHLQVPKVFLTRGAAVYDPDLHETVYPLVTEMLYAVALAVRGPVACRLVQWVLGLCLAASVTALARPVLGPRARWAATVALLVPAVSNGMGAPLNDVALAAFGTAALVAWLRWRDRPSPGTAVLAGALAGLALGVKYPALVWVGLLGLSMLAAGSGQWAVGRAKNLVPTLRVGMPSLTLCVSRPSPRPEPELGPGGIGPRRCSSARTPHHRWDSELQSPLRGESHEHRRATRRSRGDSQETSLGPGRERRPGDAERQGRHSHAERGNEISPPPPSTAHCPPPTSLPLSTAHCPLLIAHCLLFGAVALLVGGVWYLRAFVHTGNPVYPFFRQVFGGAGIDDVLDPIKRPLPVTCWNLLTALVPMTLQPDRFDSLSHQFGPAFLLFLPALFLERPPRRVWGIVALALAFLTACLTLRQSMRFVLIAVGPMAVGVAWLAGAWHERRTVAARLLLGVVVLMLGFESALALARARHGIGVVLGRETAEAYLTRREPSYRVGRWAAEHLPEDARLVGQDHRGFYIPRPYTMELAHRRRTSLGTRGETAEAIVAHLRREGFTHLLLCPPVPETAVEFDPTLGRRLAPWLASHSPLYREEITDPDGVVRRYSIYDLTSSQSLAAGNRGLPR